MLRDLAPPAQFESLQPSLLEPQFPTADPHQIPALSFSPHPPSPIPLITSPSPLTSADTFSALIPASLTSVTSCLESSPASFSLAVVTPEPNCSLTEVTNVTSEGLCHNAANFKDEDTYKNLSPLPFSAEASCPEPIAVPVSPLAAASLSSEHLTCQVAFGSCPASAIPSMSPSTSCCPSPSPSSPPPLSLSPCPVCQCTCAPSNPAPAHKHNDPSTMEILI